MLICYFYISDILETKNNNDWVEDNQPSVSKINKLFLMNMWFTLPPKSFLGWSLRCGGTTMLTKLKVSLASKAGYVIENVG